MKCDKGAKKLPTTHQSPICCFAFWSIPARRANCVKIGLSKTVVEIDRACIIYMSLWFFGSSLDENA